MFSSGEHHNGDELDKGAQATGADANLGCHCLAGEVVEGNPKRDGPLRDRDLDRTVRPATFHLPREDRG